MCEYYVEIVKRDGNEVVKRMGPHPERQADKIQRGASINLNHDDYFVRIKVEDSEVPCGTSEKAHEQ